MLPRAALVVLLSVGVVCEDAVPLLSAAKCGTGKEGIIKQFWLTTSLGLEAPKQATSGSVCWDADGWVVDLHAKDTNGTSTAAHCNDQVWMKGAVMEVFFAPVADPFDAPVYYYEMDTASTGALWGSVMNNEKGNATDCLLTTCPAGSLPCTGVSTFPTGPSSTAQKTEDGWAIKLRVPWSMFKEPYRLQADGTPYPHWRANFYRYDYPNGPAYELSGWSPTHNPSFHIPQRFGRVFAA